MSSKPFFVLRRLAEQRVLLLRQLAPLLRRVSPANAQRSTIEKKRTIHRKQLKEELTKVDAQIVSIAVQYIMQKSHDPNHRRSRQQQYRRGRRLTTTFVEDEEE